MLVNHPDYHETFVYGNVLIEPDGEGNRQIVHYGGDSGTTADYRKGTLYFHHNTVISTRTGNTTLMRLSTNDEHADIRNNILFTTADGSRLAMVDESGVVDLRTNWIMDGWVDSHSGLSGTLTDHGDNLTGTDPGSPTLRARTSRRSREAPARMPPDHSLRLSSPCTRRSTSTCATGAPPPGPTTGRGTSAPSRAV